MSKSTDKHINDTMRFRSCAYQLDQLDSWTGFLAVLSFFVAMRKAISNIVEKLSWDTPLNGIVSSEECLYKDKAHFCDVS